MNIVNRSSDSQHGCASIEETFVCKVRSHELSVGLGDDDHVTAKMSERFMHLFGRRNVEHGELVDGATLLDVRAGEIRHGR